MTSPFQVIKDFEDAVADYTGAPYVVAVNSCTNALFLCLKWQYIKGGWIEGYRNLVEVEIPKHTYVSVPMQIMHAGYEVKFRDENWSGWYQLRPFHIYDSARRFHAGMYNFSNHMERPHTYICTSHHWTKILGIQHGGCILHNDSEFDKWARRARHDGRTEGQPITSENVPTLGFHMPMPPENAAAGLVRLASLPKYNDDLPWSDYPDLSTFEVFK